MPRKIDGQRLRAFREQKRWTQKQLAEAAGLNPRTVQCIEQSDVASRAALAAIAVALRLELADLLSTGES